MEESKARILADAFLLSIVYDDVAHKTNTISNYIPVLQHFILKPRYIPKQGQRPFLNQEEHDVLEATLVQLIYFCTESSDTDPFQRSGVPIAENQDMLRDAGIVDPLLRVMLEVPFRPQVREKLINQARIRVITENRSLPQRAVNPEELHADPTLTHILRLVYKCIYQFLMGECRENELSIACHFEFFQSQLSYGLDAAHMMMELVSNNRPIIDCVKPRHIDVFIEMIRKSGRDPILLEFLKVLCSGIHVHHLFFIKYHINYSYTLAGEVAVKTHQNYICQKLLIDEKKSQLISLTRVDGNKVHIQEIPTSPWVTLQDFCARKGSYLLSH
jgi:hypothetical protein